ncbi:MAG: DNA polymerase III subunit gamma/tau [Desulfobacteraceae bacterium]|nr:MAG: DNA polymerase III subunit gamma/tau [Desulfobacteraceae bacterium]
MSYLVLARKYRPQTFEEVIGQTHVTRTLKNAITSNRVAHAILFSGPRGTGKTTVARILAKAMNCEEGPVPEPCNLCRSCREIRSGSAVDVYEIDGASNNSVDQIRELRENVKYTPIHSRYKIYIIDEVHMLSIQAFNALLKTLEEPPSHILFIFATTEPHKIPVTILSRCQRHEFHRIEIASVRQQLESICGKEEIRFPSEGLWLIAREAGGSMRDALSLLDLVITCGEGGAASEQIVELLGVVDRKVIFDISSAVLSGNISSVLELLDSMYERGCDMKKLYTDLVEHFRNMLVVKMGKSIRNLVDLPNHEIEQIEDQVRNATPAFLHQLFDLLFREESTLRFSLQPKLVLETAFLRMCRLKPTLSLDELIEKLEALRQTISVSGSGSGPGHGSGSRIRDGGSIESGASPPASKDRAEATERLSAQPSRESMERVETIERLWKNILDAAAEKYPLIGAALTKCELISVGKEELEIAVNGSAFNLSLLQRSKNQQILTRLFEHLLGRKMRILLVSKVESAPDNQKKKVREDRLKQEALSHPLVAEAVEVFSGKIVDVKIL